MATQQDNWEAVKALFEAALEQDVAGRSSFLRERCQDASVCAEVERLLAEHDQAASFLSTAPLSDPVPGPASDPASTTQELSVSQVLAGRFRIVRFIAGGGMGEVYEADDQELRERVAVKTIRPEILVQSNAMARFKREVLLARKVTHPNVCRIFDLFRHRPEGGGERDEIVFISMELLRGKSLAARLKERGRMGMGEALPLIGQMASALAAAHDVGIVHRDFKPGNVVLVGVPGQDTERAVVTDFGLALQSLASDEGISFSTGPGLLGTPAYMAPEQLECRPATKASDVYALGLVIYEMLTGERPFTGDNPLASAFKRLTEAPRSPRNFVPDMSPACESVILRCLARHPADRFPNAREVAVALAENTPQFLTTRPSAIPLHPRPTSKTSRSIIAGISILLILAALAGVGVYEWRTRHPIVKPFVMVAGLKNDSGDRAYDWLATDLSETLTADLGASTDIQTVPPDELARVRTELSIPPTQNLESQSLAEVRQALGANYVVLGSYSINAKSLEKTLSLDLHLEDSSGKTLGSFQRSGNETEYGKLVTEVAAEVLSKLGKARLLETEASQLQNLYPSNREARKLYFEAVDKLRSLDAPGALELLKKAAQQEPGNVAIHSALADTWSQLKHDPEAAEEAKKAAELAGKTPLPFEYIVLARARSEEMTRDWASASKDYGLLFPHYEELSYGLQLANAQLEGSQPKAALDTLNQLSGLRPPMNSDPRIEITKAKVYAAMNDFSGELRSAQLALSEAQKRGARLMQANAELELCWAHRNLGHVDDAFAACNQAETLFSASGDPVNAAIALNDLATWYLDRGRYDEARQTYERVIKIHRDAGAQKDLAGANVNMAVALVRMGKPQDAQGYIDTALHVAASIQDKEDEARAYILKGQVLSAGGHQVEAGEQVRKALALAQDLGNTGIQSTALSNLAQYQAEIDTGSALATYKKVLQLRRANSDPAAVATCLFNMGDVQYRRGEFDASEASYREAIKISTEQKDQAGVALGFMSLAEINLERKRVSEAERQALDALEKLKEAPDPNLESIADSILLRLEVEEGKLSEAESYADRIRKIASQDPDTSFENHISLATYLKATGHTTEAVQQIRSLPAEAKQRGSNFAALEAELFLLELEADGHASSGARKEALSSIRKRAERAGFGLLTTRMAHVRV
ncbi:MAG TPA: protein kinase [Candidatus Sulfotelmatobacter sp.]|nr:protein kinase [Candidatus Sulfotelmatobacter sp.]